MRVKKMPEHEFEQVMKYEWRPKGLAGNAVPGWAKNIPSEISYFVAASGTRVGTDPYHSPTIPSGVLIGGIDVYRRAPDDHVQLNKDWYAVVSVRGEPQLLVDGPFKDIEHWVNELPSRVKGIEVFGVPKNPYNR